MAVLHDLACDKCETVYIDVLSTAIGGKCSCGGSLEIYYGNWGKRNAVWLDEKSSTVVYEHPVTHKIIYPARNDQPMPERYQRTGFERRRLSSLAEIRSFGEKHGVVNEAADYDPGSGRGYDSEPGRR
jgi:hypothetical protein